MHCDNERPGATRAINIDKVAGRLSTQHHIYVCPTSASERLRLIECLESNGFVFGDDSRRGRKEAHASQYPLSINLAERRYSALRNTTCSACAAASRIVVTEKEFYRFYEDLPLHLTQ